MFLIKKIVAVFESATAHFDNPKRSAKLTKMREKLQAQFGEILGDSNAIFLFPTHPDPAPFHNQALAQPFNFVYTAIFNSLLLPATQCPLGGFLKFEF